MDFPSFNHHHHHHHHRYAPPPPPPPPHNDRPNFYHHLIPSVNHPPPPPHSYPPPPPVLPPPPPSYNPDFTFLDAPKPSFFRSPPRVSNRFDYRAGSRSDLDWPPHRNPIELYSPNPQLENYYKPRFIDDINDEQATRDFNNIVSHEQQIFSSRNLESYVEKYEPRYMPASENNRIWEEEAKWVMKGKNNELDGASFAYGRERDYEHLSGKYNRFREGRDEYKQVQKKSVLLRIGKLNNSNTNRNRNHEQHSSKPYVVESNNGNHRGKDKVKDRDRDRDRDQTVEGGRENSPVDLDVSFKSNALVAKPVVTPSSPVSDNNSTPSRNRKIKRATEFDSPLSKFSERSARSRSSSRGFDSPSSSEKAPKQDKDSVSKWDNKEPVSKRVKVSLSGPVLDQGDGNKGSKGPLSFRLKKKRKLMNPGSSSFDFQLAVKENDVKVESSKNIPKTRISSVISFPTPQLPVKENDAKVESSKNISNARISSVISFPTLEEVVSGKMDKSPKEDVLEVQSQKLDCVNKNLTAENVSVINDGVVSDLNQLPCGNEVLVNFENDIRNTSADVKLSPGVTDIFATSADDQIEIQKLSTESVSLEVVNVSNSLCSESVKMQETSPIADKNSDVSNILCNEYVKMQETSTTADANFLESCSDEIIIISPEKSEDQGFLDDVSRKEDESRVLEDTSNQISLNGSSESTKDDFEESTHIIIVEDNAAQSSPHKEHSFNKDTVTEMVNLISSSVCTPSPDHKEPTTDSKDDLPLSSANDTSTFVTDSNAKSGEPIPDIPTGICSPKNVSISDSQMLDTKSTDKMLSNLSIPENDGNIFVKSVSKDIAQLNPPKTGIKTSQYEVTNAVPSASQGSNARTIGSNTNLPFKKPSSGPAVSRVLAARSLPVFTNARINKTANNITKPRTWHRSSNPTSVPVSVPLPPKQIARGQNSYVRSGNSLVRKGAPVTAIASRSSVYQLNPSGPSEARNSSGSGNKMNNTYSRVVGSSAPVVRPKTPPLSGSTKLPDCPTDSRELSSSPLEVVPASSVEQRVSEDQIRTSSNSESQKIVDEVVIGKKVQYVKRKSNQLVAASCSDQPIQDLDKTQPSLSSDSYYKRIKNQLIRTSVGDDPAKIDKASKISIKRQSGKVWTLNTQSLRPQLFPWKRSRNWGYLMNASSNSSSSSISRKLLLSRKRETIYTRSKHGFSLRMSKLLSVGGASLKWSKSIERNSKRTNEEATLAVAAADKKKREQLGTASATAETKSRNNMSRARIFRIGKVRYKMDPSRRTLQRISDEEPSNSVQSKEEVKKTYIPKRLKIGHDEYVRIGNGNQLVRNPKRRTRVFANEKVRWSLHTARTRLAKKKKFCQFFTRFGKCNKDDGKCPYIHDSSKIAVCTKFLNGLCSDPNCKLTHKVIPERMQDCSYFLQGLCSNKHCPYRHVNVNSTASVCEGFLKGYCADGNECQKKHSYACPAFEATGSCSQGTKCKLHHPKNQLKRKRQSSMEQETKNSRGRYFGSVRGEEVVRVSEKSYLKNDDVEEGMLCEEGKFAEYISLDCGSEDGGDEAIIGDTRTRLIGEPLGLGVGVGETDELTKPVGIMNRVVLLASELCDKGVS